MEKQIERYLGKKIKERGGLCLKLTGYKGIPDRIILLNGNCYFVELKDTGKRLRPEQEAWQEVLRCKGFTCLMLDSKESIDGFVREIEGRK